MVKVNWYGCYDGSWQSAPLVAEAYAHPAKVSFNLAERIYRHMLAEGWLAPGDVVVDPFGGIGGFAFHAALYGMHWRGVELEQKFVDLGGQNLELWRNRYAAHFPGYGSARLVQGDSRRLVDVLREAGAVVSSPPYSETRIDGNGDEGASGLRDEDGNYLRGAEGWQKRKELGARYGGDPANLGNMPAGVVSSPPFEASVGNLPTADSAFWQKRQETWGSRVASQRRIEIDTQTYGSTPGNIGNNTGDTFWSAAALIIAQCYDILKPGGYAAWVTGDFVRNKKRVPFGEQWLALCESVGFEPVMWATAWKAESHGEQLDIFGNGHEQGKTKVSFFRRLANQKNPDTAIVNEDVLFVRKPL